MPYNFSGKYWRINELEKELGKPASFIYQIIKSLNGTIKLGTVYLVPDLLMPEIVHRSQIADSYSQKTACIILSVQPKIMDALIASGLPILKDGENIRIYKKYIGSLQRAICEIKMKEGRITPQNAPKAVKLAMAYMKEEGDD